MIKPIALTGALTEMTFNAAADITDEVLMCFGRGVWTAVDYTAEKVGKVYGEYREIKNRYAAEIAAYLQLEGYSPRERAPSIDRDYYAPESERFREYTDFARYSDSSPGAWDSVLKIGALALKILLISSVIFATGAGIYLTITATSEVALIKGMALTFFGVLALSKSDW